MPGDNDPSQDLNMSSTARLVESIFQFRVDPDRLSEILRGIGLTNPSGELYRERVKKLYEVVFFSLHVVKALERVSKRRRNFVVDCGCGRSYLSFFLNYLLFERLGRNLFFFGVDSDPILVETCERIRRELEYENMGFQANEIIDLKLPKNVEKVDLVYSLHACDTATDQAIAKGVQLESTYVIAVPCCQRQVVRQLVGLSSPSSLHPLGHLVQRHVFREELGVTLTESLRVLAMESLGYKVDVFDFVPERHTPKNLMLRGRRLGRLDPRALREYRQLRDYFRVKPAIEEYLPQLSN